MEVVVLIVFFESFNCALRYIFGKIYYIEIHGLVPFRRGFLESKEIDV